MNHKLHTQVVIEYLEKFPNTPSRTLARLIYRDNSILYKDDEHVRSLIRCLKGKNGKYNRIRFKNSDYAKQFQCST